MNQPCKKMSRRIVRVVVACALTVGYGVGAWAAGPTAKGPALKLYTDPQHVDADFQFQGEYTGTVSQPDGGKMRLGAQVRALGDGVFRTMFFAGGLPGEGWDGKTIIQKAPSTDDSTPEDAKLQGNKVVIDQVYKAVCDGRTLAGQTDAGVKFDLVRVMRRSPTLGAKPPAGAIVLFDGSGTNEWLPGAKLTPQKWLIGGATTRRKFQNFTLHVEFMISYVPRTRTVWQRPNSGVFLQQRYEIQILDSFGIVMRKHDCGVLYAQITPTINMCYPPLTWQTYDIDFTAARYDVAGKKTKLGRCTVKLNGVVILDDVEIKHSTPSGMPESPQPGGIYLQEHGFPAFFQNVWIVEKRPLRRAPAETKPPTRPAAKRAPDPALLPVEDVPNLPRVLLIGDSISMGYTLQVRELLKGKANVHHPPENCGNTERGLAALDAWLGEKKWDVIHFNFGLHDLKYLNQTGEYVTPDQGKQVTPLPQYEQNLRQLIGRLKKTGAKIVWCSTTPVPEGAKGRVKDSEVEYNTVAAKVAAESGIAIDDLHAVAKARQAELQRPHDVHFTAEGCKVLAKAVAASIEQALGR